MFTVPLWSIAFSFISDIECGENPSLIEFTNMFLQILDLIHQNIISYCFEVEVVRNHDGKLLCSREKPGYNVYMSLFPYCLKGNMWTMTYRHFTFHIEMCFTLKNEVLYYKWYFSVTVQWTYCMYLGFSWHNSSIHQFMACFHSF